MEGAARRRLGATFDPRSNALNLLRLGFALLVIVSHGIVLGAYRSEVLWGHTTLGAIAVDGFFAVSGFLIVASGARNHVGRYLWQRFLRIFPAFWVCLIVTALVAGPINWTAAGHPLHTYWSAPLGPLHYLVANADMKISVYTIGGTPQKVPYPVFWDSSLWTLPYECLCYLMVAALAVSTVLRHRRVVLGLWVLSWLLEVGLVVAGHHIVTNTPIHDLLRFVPIFFSGAIVWLYRDELPDSGVLAAACALVWLATTWLHDPELGAPLLGYACVWAGAHLPGRRIGARHDISYGVYIYAFVVAQVLATWGADRWGYVPFTLTTIVGTAAVATASRRLIEEPALRLKRWAPGRRRPPVTAPSAVAAPTATLG